MIRSMKLALGAATLAFAIPQAAIAQETPVVQGAEWVEVTGIETADGAGYKYIQWLAGEWRQRMDYMVEQGWLESYEIWSNAHPRADEPDLYLIRRFQEFESNDESDQRGQMMRDYMERSIAQLETESGNRAEYREVGSTVLLKRLVWRE